MDVVTGEFACGDTEEPTVLTRVTELIESSGKPIINVPVARAGHPSAKQLETASRGWDGWARKQPLTCGDTASV